MPNGPRIEDNLSQKTRDFYCKVLAALHETDIAFLVGGAFAVGYYTGVVRDTKDFDIFVHPRDARSILDVLSKSGYRTELADNVWLGKAFNSGDLVDVIFGFANGISQVDDTWFAHACTGTIFDFSIRLVSPEEMIWSKVFVMTRDRYDGADIAHILLTCADAMDWQRLLDWFQTHWLLLYNHLMLFGYIYPSERSRIPPWVMQELAARLSRELSLPPAPEAVCRGTLLSQSEYALDVERWGYRDARIRKPVV